MGSDWKGNLPMVSISYRDSFSYLKRSDFVSIVKDEINNAAASTEEMNDKP